MVTSNDLVLRRSRIESSARWARIRKPRDKWGWNHPTYKGWFHPMYGIYNWRSGAHPCHRHPRSAPDRRQVQKMMRDPQGSRLLVQHLSARPKVRKLEFFGTKNTVKQMDGWLDSQWFTGFLQKNGGLHCVQLIWPLFVFCTYQIE